MDYNEELWRYYLAVLNELDFDCDELGVLPFADSSAYKCTPVDSFRKDDDLLQERFPEAIRVGKDTFQQPRNKPRKIIEINLSALDPLFEIGKRDFVVLLQDYRKRDQQTLFNNQNETVLDVVSRGLITLVGDSSLLWNSRKDLLRNRLNITTSVQDGSLHRIDSIQDANQVLSKELALIHFALRRFPKAAEAWSWLWDVSVLIINNKTSQPLDDFVLQEMQFCERIAMLSQQNYYAWKHRLLCLNRRVNSASDWKAPNLVRFAHNSSCLPFLLHEWEKSTQWIQLHVSDSSAFHYRRNLLFLILQFGSEDNAHWLAKEEEFMGELDLRYENTGAQSREVHLFALKNMIHALNR